MELLFHDLFFIHVSGYMMSQLRSLIKHLYTKFALCLYRRLETHFQMPIYRSQEIR